MQSSLDRTRTTLRRGNYEAAAAVLEQRRPLAASADEASEVELLLGSALLEQGLTEVAQAPLQEAAARDSRHQAAAQLLLAVCYYESQDFEFGSAAAAAALQLMSDSKQAMLMAGLHQQARHRHDIAKPLLRHAQLLLGTPQLGDWEPDIMLWRGQAACALGEIAVAETHLRQACAATPRRGLPRRWLARCLRLQGQTEAEGMLLEQLQALQPRSAMARWRQAMWLLRQGREPLAVERLHAGLALRPDSALCHHALGCLLGHQDDLQAALRHFQAAVHGVPFKLRPMADLLRLLVLLGRGAEAETFARDRVAQYPQTAHCHYLLGLCLSAQCRDGEALPALRQCLTLQSHHVEAAALLRTCEDHIEMAQQLLLRPNSSRSRSPSPDDGPDLDPDVTAAFMAVDAAP